MRVPALICICCSIVGAGVAYTAHCRRRLRALEAFARYFGVLALGTRTAGGTVETLLTQEALPSGGFSFPSALAGALRTAAPAEAWRRALETCAEGRYLTGGETAFLETFGAAFNESAMEAFCEKCAVYERKLNALYLSAAQKNEKTEKLGVSFAALLAALTFLVLF